VKTATKKILLGLGCAVVLLILMCGGIVAGGLSLLFTRFENREPVRAALAHAQADERIGELLGVPLEIAFTRRPLSVHRDRLATRVELEMSIRGPRGSGDLFATGVRGRDDPTWDWRRFTVYVRGEAVELSTPRDR
jgi:hypothetical protein